LVFGVLGNEDEEVQANDGDDDYKPAEGEDEEERDFLAHGDLQFPELADGERGDEEVRCDVEGCVGVVHAVCGVSRWVYGGSEVGLRVLVNAFGKGLHGHVPVGVHWDACEDGRQDSGGAASRAKAHCDVDWQSGGFGREDAPVLQEDREFGQRQGYVVCDDAEEEVLCTSAKKVQVDAHAYLEDEIPVCHRQVDEVSSIAVSCSLYQTRRTEDREDLSSVSNFFIRHNAASSVP
jgi:hypothetical protein